MSGASAVQKHSLADVLQNRCQACNFIKKRLQHRCFPMKFTKSLRTSFFLQNTSTLMAASSNKQCKPMKTLKVYVAEKEMIHLNGTSKVSVSK